MGQPYSVRCSILCSFRQRHLYYSTSYDMPVAFGIRCVLDLYCSNILQTSGLQLCDHGASSSYGAAQCYWLNGGCQGTNNNNCYPNHMWSGSLLETGYYRAFKLISSNLTTSDVCDGAGKCVAGGGFSVRCVLVLIPADVLQLCEWGSKLFLRRCAVRRFWRRLPGLLQYQLQPGLLLV